MKQLPVAFLVLAATAVFPHRADAASCAELAKATLPQTTVTTAELVAPGTFKPPAGPAAAQAVYARLPEFCRVAATLRPTSDSDIRIEVWLPKTGWNGKLQAVGNGGFAGTIS